MNYALQLDDIALDREYDKWGNSANEAGEDLRLLEGCFVLDYNDEFYWKSSIPWKEEIDVYPTASCDFAEWLETQCFDFIATISGDKWDNDEGCRVEWRYLTTNKPFDDPEWQGIVDKFTSRSEFTESAGWHILAERDYLQVE